MAVARILGVGMTPLSYSGSTSATTLMIQALAEALSDAGIATRELDGLVAIPSLMSDQKFMIAHALATQVRRCFGEPQCAARTA